MNLNDIKVFIYVVEAGSFAAASKTLEMPSTTVSRKVQMLEAALGVKLLHRSTRKLSLTEEGLLYFQRCRQHLAALEEANEWIQETQQEPKGKIRITSPVDFAIKYVHPWIVDFIDRYPNVAVELDTSDEYVNMIEDRVDIAFRSGTLSDSSLIARRLGPKQNVCCASPEFLKTIGNIVVPEDLEQVGCIVYGKSLAQARWHFIKGGQSIHIPVSGKYATNSMKLVVEAALEGVGIAYVPITLINAYLKSGQLVQVLADYDTPKSNMFIIYQSHRYMAKPVRLFIDHVMNKVTQADFMELPNS
ncbi:LysR substrate-binding domain-containing protein [Vibrio sp. TRT 17S01]|uniref:LysR family transcriptional regulator n=1 Tax=Vibrio sp. TRT 17S01 TaxID=3418505 RepID=UPI003CF13995